MHTISSSDRLYCQKQDTLIDDSKELLLPTYLLQADEICRFGEYNNICEPGKNIIGPIKARPTSSIAQSSTQAVYYFTNRIPLET